MKIDKNEIKNILGDKFDEVKDFFRNVIEAECAYKILITRRSYLLFCFFRSILEQELGKELKHCGSFLNSHSIDCVPADYEGKILIVDDIIVNGRTVHDVIKKVCRITGSENVAVWCIRCNAEAKFLDEIERFLKHVIYIMPHEWEGFSEKLTGAIISANTGYISFVDSYYWNEADIEQIKASVEVQAGMNISDNTTRALEGYGIKSAVVWGNLIEEEIAERFGIIPCIRFYEKTSDTQKRLLVIPYVFLPSLKIGDVCVYCLSLLREMNMSCQIPDRLASEDEGTAIMLYKWTVKELSKKILNSFSQKIDLEGDRENCFECDESYPFDGGMREMTLAQLWDTLKICDAPGNEETDFCVSVFKKVMISNREFRDALSYYIKNMRTADEERAKQNKGRYCGLRICDILNYDKAGKAEIQRRLSDVISFWDCGKISYVVEAFKDADSGEKFIGGFLRHGEQAFKELYLLYNDVYEAFFEFFIQRREFRESKVVEFAKYFDEKMNTKRFSDFAEKIEYDNYLSDLMAITPENVFSECVVNDVEKAVSFYVNNYYKA